MKGFFTEPHKEDGVVCVPCIPMGSHTVLPSCLRVLLCSAVLQAAWASGSALLLAGPTNRDRRQLLISTSPRGEGSLGPSVHGTEIP